MPASVRFSITWRNLEKFKRTMRGAPKEFMNELDTKIRRTLEFREHIARVYAPFRTGKLRRGIKVRKERKYVYSLVVSSREVPYAIYQHEGTRYIKAKKFISRALVGVKTEIYEVVDKWKALARRKFGWR